MRYYINGQEVSEKTFSRDQEDNFNASIPCELLTKLGVDGEEETYMTYEEES